MSIHEECGVFGVFSGRMADVANISYYGLYALTSINILALTIAVVMAVLVYFILVIKMGAVSEEELRSMPKGHLLVKVAKKMRLLKEEAEISFQKEISESSDDDYWLDD